MSFARPFELPLHSVKPQKAIYVSRLSPDTTPECVKNPLCSELNATPDNFIINKFNFKQNFIIYNFSF